MRCKTCDYPLWNLKARQCPECGGAFFPSQFEFVGNSVKFGCPHCNQTYYGTGEKGHLVPPEFTCVSCSRLLGMDEMVLFPAEGLAEEHTKVDRVAWQERSERGWFKSWFATIGMVLVAPHRVMKAVPLESSSGPAWTFALFTWLMYMLTGWVMPILVIGIILFATNDNDAPKAFVVAGVGYVSWMLGMLIYLALWGLITHGMLRITGGCAHSIARTYQAICYSTAGFVLSVVPLVGPYCSIYLGWIWPVVSATLMIRDGQQVHGGRAALAVLVFPASLVALFFLSFVLMATFMGGARTFATGGAASNALATQAITADVINFAIQHGGAGPSHGLELIDSSSIATFGYVTADSMTGMSDVPVGNQTLEDLFALATNRRQIAVQGAIDALPPGVVAHRVGDFVFTHHGMNFNNPQAGLWIVVLWPDPDVNGAPAPMQTIAVGHADGLVTQWPAQSIAAMLQVQNRLRASAGLPPLPVPSAVTHDSPAVRSTADDATADDR